MTTDGHGGGATGHREDPGWPSGGQLLRLLLPFGHLTLVRADGGRPPIVQLRLILLSFAASMVLILLVAGLVLPPDVAATDQPLPWVLLGVGAVAAIAGPGFARRRGLTCGPPEQLAAQYRNAFFVAAAFAQSAAMLGFVAAFTIDGLWPYLVGLVSSAVGLAGFAPTRSRIATLERELQASGCPHAVSAALFAAPSSE